jgi:hypothetical protein
VSAAREFYVNSEVLPRKQLNVQSEPVGVVDHQEVCHSYGRSRNRSSQPTFRRRTSRMTGCSNTLHVINPALRLLHSYFSQRSSNVLQDLRILTVTTKQSDLGWGIGPRDGVRYMPAPESMQRFLFTSPRTGRSTWLQGQSPRSQ